MPTVALGALVLLLGGALVACSDGSDENASEASPSPDSTTDTAVAAAALDGTTYSSTSVDGHELVPGSRIQLGFEGEVMSASAGCNTLFGSYELSGTTLAWVSEPASTMMACEPELAEQDQWLTDLLSAGVTATSDGDTLVLTSDGVTVRLASEAEDGLEGLLGRTWTVIGTVTGGTTSRLPVQARRPWLTVRDDGLARLFTGCNSGRTTVRIDGTSIGFANTRVTQGTCRGPAAKVERAVLELLAGPSDFAELRDNLLIVTRDGEGLLFEIS